MSHLHTEIEFFFRVWVHPYDGDPPEIEVWWYGLEPTSDYSRGWISDWAKESLCNEDFWELFDLDKEKHYQVVGKGTLRGWHDYFGEYDEAFDLEDYDIAEVPDAYFTYMERSEELCPIA